MIIHSLCNTCLQPFTITVQASDAHLLKQISTDGATCLCPRLCGGSINLVGDGVIEQMAGDRRLKEPMQLTVRELYKAVNGAGLPDEVPKDLTVIEALLRAYGLEGVSLEQDGDKFYIHELRLLGGVTFHLTAGARGAQIIKITKEKPHGVSSSG